MYVLTRSLWAGVGAQQQQVPPGQAQGQQQQHAPAHSPTHGSSSGGSESEGAGAGAAGGLKTLARVQELLAIAGGLPLPAASQPAGMAGVSEPEWAAYNPSPGELRMCAPISCFCTLLGPRALCRSCMRPYWL